MNTRRESIVRTKFKDWTKFQKCTKMIDLFAKKDYFDEDYNYPPIITNFEVLKK